MITTPTSTPTRTAMALPKHSHQALFLLHTLVYIMVFFRRHARVFTPALPHFELHPASSQSPRPRRAQGQFTMLFFLHSMLRDLLSELLHRRQPGSPAPSPLTMETVTRHRVNRNKSVCAPYPAIHVKDRPGPRQNTPVGQAAISARRSTITSQHQQNRLPSPGHVHILGGVQERQDQDWRARPAPLFFGCCLRDLKGTLPQRQVQCCRRHRVGKILHFDLLDDSDFAANSRLVYSVDYNTVAGTTDAVLATDTVLITSPVDGLTIPNGPAENIQSQPLGRCLAPFGTKWRGVTSFQKTAEAWHAPRTKKKPEAWHAPRIKKTPEAWNAPRRKKKPEAWHAPRTKKKPGAGRANLVINSQEGR